MKHETEGGEVGGEVVLW